MAVQNDLTGKRFGQWLVLHQGTTQTHPQHRIRYWCQCDCGAARLVHAGNLTRGVSTSCGCSRLVPLGRLHESLRIDLTGHRYGMLTVLRRTQVKPTKWLCVCDCGGECTVLSFQLRSGPNPRWNCGCARRGCKLTSRDVTAIKELYKLPNYTMKRIGKLFHVDISHVSRIVRGLSRGGIGKENNQQ